MFHNKNEQRHYERVNYDQPLEDREERVNGGERRPPVRRRFDRPSGNSYRFRRPMRRRRFIRKPFVVEVVFTEDATTLQLPIRATTKSAGADIKALFDGVIPAHGMLTGVRTGIKIKIPDGTVGWITPRSGMSSKGIIIPNSPGEIDSDYRGEILVNFANLSDTDYEFKKGDRIAQITFCPIRKGTFNAVPEFSPARFYNTRNEGGFGSTGVNDSDLGYVDDEPVDVDVDGSDEGYAEDYNPSVTTSPEPED